MTAQERREVGVDRGGLGAREQPSFVRDLVRRGDVLEAHFSRERCERALHLGMAGGVDQRDRHRPVSARALRRERCARRGEVERLDLGSVGTDAPAHLEHRARQRRRLADRQLEQLRTLLRPDREQIAEARVGDEERRARRAARAARWWRRWCPARRARARCSVAPARSRICSISCAGASSDDSSFAMCSEPSGATPIPSVKVPPRSIQNDQRSGAALIDPCARDGARSRAPRCAAEDRRRAARRRTRRRRTIRHLRRDRSRRRALPAPSGGTAAAASPAARPIAAARAVVSATALERRSAVAHAQEHERRDRVGVHRDHPGHREPRCAAALAERPIESRCPDRDRAAEPHRRPGMAARVEAAHGDLLSDPGRHREREDLQQARDTLRVRGVEVSALEQQSHDRLREHERCCCRRARQRETCAQRAEQRLVQLRFAPFGREPCERRERGRRNRLTYHGHGQQHQLAGVGERGDRPDREPRPEPLVVPLVDRDHRRTEHERQRGEEIAVQRGIAQIDPDAHREHAPRLEPGRPERSQHRACQRAPREALGAELAPERDAARDDREVVDQRRERLRHEVPARHQRAAQHSTGDEEDLRGQQDPRQPRRQRRLLGREAELERDQAVGGEPHRQRADRREQRRRAEHEREKALRGLLPFPARGSACRTG